jgi:hypothetical protein
VRLSEPRSILYRLSAVLADTAITTTTVSKGQALIDLKTAFDSGAMSRRNTGANGKRILNGP